MPGHLPLQTSAAAVELRLALVIGINRYKHERAGRYFLPPLCCAEPDAEPLAKFLREELDFVVKPLTGAEATGAAVREMFAWLKGTTATDPRPNSCFVFHFSGHGFLDPDNEEDAYLMLHDSDPREPAAAGLKMAQLVYQLVPQVRVPNTLVLLDACHAGFAAGVKDVEVCPANQLGNVVRQLVSSLRGRMVLAACPGDAQAREEPSLGHGIFTHYVLKHWGDRDGAASTGRITFGSLVDHVGHTMPMDHPHVPLPVSSWVGEGPTFVLRPGKPV